MHILVGKRKKKKITANFLHKIIIFSPKHFAGLVNLLELDMSTNQLVTLQDNILGNQNR